MIDKALKYAADSYNYNISSGIINRVFKYDSVIPLILVNLIPIIGVLFFEWSIGIILLTYSLENIVIGFFNVLRMATAQSCYVKGYSRLGLILFFMVHYGMFSGGHLLFTFGLASMFGGRALTFQDTAINFIAFFISHGYSFFRNYIGGKEYKEAKAEELFLKPYGRIVIMHITIVLGAFVALILGQPIGILILMVVLKIIVDVFSHLNSHEKYWEGKTIAERTDQPDWTEPIIVN